MKWQLVLIKNSIFWILPFHSQIRRIKRKFFPYRVDPRYNDWTIRQGLLQVEMLRRNGVRIKDSITLELGTGWAPFIPIIFFLAGSRKVFLIDKQRLLNRQTLLSALEQLKRNSHLLSKELGIPDDTLIEQLTVPGDWGLERIFDRFNFTYSAPSDARSMELPDESVDIILSRAVFEYIPPPIIEEILTEFRRVLKNDGRMCHIIDNSDHWAGYDRSISKVNFLKFEDNVWRFTSINPLDYLNRLRHYEYVEMLDRSGFKIENDDSKPDEEAISALRSMKVCKRYRGVPVEELAIMTSHFVASKKLS